MVGEFYLPMELEHVVQRSIKGGSMIKLRSTYDLRKFQP